jgi:hypothetical protein
MFSLLTPERRSLVQVAFLDEKYFVACFTNGDDGRPPAGTAIKFLCLPQDCQEFVEEALTTQACSSASVYNIDDEWFVTAERGGYLLLGGMNQPEKNPAIQAAAKRQAELFKVSEFFTTTEGLVDLFGGLAILGFGAFLLLGPLWSVLTLSTLDPNPLLAMGRTLFLFLLIFSLLTGLSFLLHLPVKRWFWRRKANIAISRLLPASR